MRVSESARFDLMQHNLALTTGRLNDVSQRLATGRNILKLSDSPELAVRAERMTAETRAIEAYVSAADNAGGWLREQDNSLQGVMNVLHRVRELTISAGSANSPAGMQGIADELEGLQQQLMDLANTSFNGRSVFGGFGDRAIAQSGSSFTFVGDQGAVERRVSPERVVTVNTNGWEAFGFASGDDVFTFVGDIAAHVRAGDSVSLSGTDLDRLAVHQERFSEALGSVGAITNQVESAASAGQARRDALRGYIGQIMETDIAEAALEMSTAETAYQAVLAATARLQGASLVDFLR